MLPVLSVPSVPSRVAAAGAALALALGLSACSDNQLSSGGEQGFVTADGSVQVLPAADREPPAYDVAGETVDGEPIGLDDYAGDVVVMPVWGSWCAPCRAEAPLLASAARDLADEGVRFLGINNRDRDRIEATRFAEQFELPYPSIYDPDGNTLLSFRGTLPPLAVPSMVVIDGDGRVAARIIGKATTATLYGVVEDVLGRTIEPPREGADAAEEGAA